VTVETEFGGRVALATVARTITGEILNVAAGAYMRT